MTVRPICRGCGHEKAHHNGKNGECTYGHGTATGGCDCSGFGNRRRKAETVGLSADDLLIRTGELLKQAGETMIFAAQMMSVARAPAPAPEPLRAKPAVRSAPVSRNNDLSKGQVTVLQRIVQHGTLTRGELSTLTGYKRSTRNRLLAELSALHCITTSGEVVMVTDLGISKCGPVEKLPTGDALREWWLERLDQGQSTMLSAISAAYPGEIEREALDRATGYARSTRNRLIAELSAAKLVTTRAGSVRASDRLFDRRS